ncbi:hypothetical protein [Streptomyces roseolus]|uniref:hypothetical protein n=1 Tax=Streptomyces roseolus TaxID=67358 RepID=UPI0037B0A429
MVLLAALAGGAGGEAGRQAWLGLSALVRRPFSRAEGMPEVSSGEPELVALEQAPHQERASALSTALAVRTALDPEFGADLRQWHEQARSVPMGDTTNTISGGTFHGTVVVGRDSHVITPPPPPAASTGIEAPQGL